MGAPACGHSHQRGTHERQVVFVDRLAVLLLVVSGLSSAPVLAQGDARIAGTVRDTSGGSVSGATVVVRNEKTGAERTTTSGPDGGYMVGSLTPSLYTVRVAAGQFAPTDTPACSCCPAQELTLDLELRPQGVTEPVTVSAAPRTRHELRAHRHERDRARGEGPAAQRPPALAALPAGARVGEQRHRHVRRHPLQRPRGRAEHHPLRRHRRHGHHRRVAGQPERRAPVAVPPAVQPRERAGVPRRVEQLSRPNTAPAPAGRSASSRSPARTAVHGSVFEYHRGDGFDSPNYFDTPSRR